VWVSVKEASEKLGVGERAIRGACKRGSKKYQFRMVDGHGGVGKIYQVWVEDVGNPYGDEVVELVQNANQRREFEKITKPINIDVETQKESKPLIKIKASKDEMVGWAVQFGMKSALERFEVTDKSLYRWVSAFKKDGGDALIDKRGKQSNISTERIERAIYACGTAHVTSWWEIYCLFYSKEMKINFDRYALTADISYITFYRHATTIAKENINVRSYLKRGLDGLALRPTIIRDWLENNEEWQIDATPIDFMALNALGEPTRYKAISIYDVGSGRMCWGLYDSPSSMSNVRLLRKVIERFGMPQYIKGDNGKDYVSKHFQGVLKRLGILYVNAQPFRGDQKGRVERGFRTIQHKCEILPGFIGHNAGDRIEREAQALEKSKRLSGVKTHLNGLLTRDELEAFLEEQIEQHCNKGWENVKHEVDRRVFGISKMVKFHANGFRFNGFIYQNLELFRVMEIGSSVEIVADIDDSSKAFVYKDGEYLADVWDTRVKSYTQEEVKAIQKEYKKLFVTGKKALVKEVQTLKDEFYKEEAGRLLQLRDEKMKEHKEKLFEKEVDAIVIEKPKKATNKKLYRPKLSSAEY